MPSDRIKSGKRKNADPHEKIRTALQKLTMILNDPSVSRASKSTLKEIHKDLTRQAETLGIQAEAERIGKPKYVTSDEAPISAEAEAKQAKRDEHKQKMQEWEAAGQPGKQTIKELGHKDQMERDIEQHSSKQAGKLSGSPRQRLATGEDVAVPSKSFGRQLDEQRKIKNAEAAAVQSAPKDTILVKPKQPQASPEQIAQIQQAVNDPKTDPETKQHLTMLLDQHMKKSIDAEVEYTPNGQWTLN